MNTTDAVKIRMYRHGFGDCFLLQFFTKQKRTFTMLIDCGLKLNDSVEGVSLVDVRDDIAKTLKNGAAGKAKPKLDVLVVTHEHWDHVSGFHPKEGLFDSFAIGKIWMAWTENPEDDDAIVLNKNLMKRVKALMVAADKIKKNTKDKEAFMLSQAKGNEMLAYRKNFDGGLGDVLGFFGDMSLKKEEITTPAGIKVKEKYTISLKTQEAIDHLRTLAVNEQTGIRYCETGEIIDNIKGLPGIRIYVLGPPKGRLLNKAAPSAGIKKEVYFGDNTLAGFVDGVLATGGDHEDMGKPFDNVLALAVDAPVKDPNITGSYFKPEEAWRTIDDDWLDMAGALAMQMDNDTNNTSLVLAFQFMDTGKVLLFPGDAQVGNWMSWHDHQWEVKNDGEKTTVDATSLLNNTVFYKVGHHCSHNATMKEKGLELMTSDELVAFIPEKEKQYPGIPYNPLLTRLEQKTKGRLMVSADSNFPAEKTMAKKPSALSGAEWQAFKKNVTLTKTFIEYTIKR